LYYFEHAINHTLILSSHIMYHGYSLTFTRSENKIVLVAVWGYRRYVSFLAPDTYNIPEKTIYGQTQYKKKKKKNNQNWNYRMKLSF